MLDDFRRLFRTSIDAFRAEINTHEPEDQVAAVLAGMRREMVASKAVISELEGDSHRVRSQLAAEKAEMERCERRAELAERLPDPETARIAREFAARHRQKVEILERKATAVEAEIALLRQEGEEMRRRYKEADANRFVLLAQLRRAAATQRMAAARSSDDGPFANLGRMEERVRSEADLVDALEELEDAPPESRTPTGAELDARLTELKRRMGRE